MRSEQDINAAAFGVARVALLVRIGAAPVPPGVTQEQAERGLDYMTGVLRWCAGLEPTTPMEAEIAIILEQAMGLMHNEVSK